MDMDTHIQRDDSTNAVSGASFTNLSPLQVEKEAKTDSGVSSIEKSSKVAPSFVPPLNFPILTPPQDNQELSSALTISMHDSNGRKVTLEILSTEFLSAKNNIIDEMLDKWADSIAEQKELVQRLLASPLYQQFQEMQISGDQRQGNVSGIQGVQSANAAAANPATANVQPLNFLTALDRLQVIEEKVPATAETEKGSSTLTKESTVLIPMTIIFAAMGGLAIGTTEVASSIGGGMTSQPLSRALEMVQTLQPLFSQVSLTNMIPVINLMVAAPLYMHAWDEAVSNFAQRERNNQLGMAQEFAKDVIKKVNDPNFVPSSLIQHMEGVENLSGDDRARLARLAKVMLMSLALGALYSAEVGKVQSGKFGGLEPEEFRALILGEFLPEQTESLSEHEHIHATLVEMIHSQLAEMGVEDRQTVAEMMLNYLGQARDFDPMLEPNKVFYNVLQANVFDPNREQIDHQLA